MKTIERVVGFILVLIALPGCTQLSGVTISPSETVLQSTQTQAALSTIPASPVSTITPVETSSAPSETSASSLGETATAPAVEAGATLAACQLVQVTQPPKPTKTYQPNELDTDAGLHITGLIQYIDLATYRLKVTGLVDHPLSLSYDELRCMPKVTDSPLLTCPGVFRDQATWAGVRISYILDLAGIQQPATKLTLVGADGYQVNLPLDTAREDKNFLAYEVNEKTLPVQHGFPLRAVFPGMWGSYWLKWLVEIRVS